MSEVVKTRPLGLLDMPTEVHWYILSHLTEMSETHARENMITMKAVLLTCRRLYEVAITPSVHTFFDDTIAYRDKGTTSRRGTPSRRPRSCILDFLRYVAIEKPWLAKFVRRVVARHVDQILDNLAYQPDEKKSLPPTPQETETYQDIVFNSGILNIMPEPEQAWDRWKQDLADGQTSAQIVVLLLVCHRLEVVRLAPTISYPPSALDLFVKAIARSHQQGPDMRLNDFVPAEIIERRRMESTEEESDTECPGKCPEECPEENPKKRPEKRPEEGPKKGPKKGLNKGARRCSKEGSKEGSKEVPTDKTKDAPIVKPKDDTIGPFLPQLRQFCCDGKFSKHFERLKGPRDFLLLPQLQTFQCSGLYDRGSSNENLGGLDPESSDVKELRLLSVQFKDPVLRGLVRACGKLTTLKYIAFPSEAGTSGISPEEAITPLSLVRMVVPLGETLEELDVNFARVWWTLGWTHKPDKFSIGRRLHWMPKLKTLKIGMEAMTGFSDAHVNPTPVKGQAAAVFEDTPSLVDLLPPYLEDLEFYGCSQEFLHKVQELINVHAEGNHLQSLRRICLHFFLPKVKKVSKAVVKRQLEAIIDYNPDLIDFSIVYDTVPYESRN